LVYAEWVWFKNDRRKWDEEETFDHAIESRTMMEREIVPIPTDIAA
jgi:hypothetical protein